MKNLVLSTVMLVGMSSLGFAQQEDLKAAAANIEKKDYIAALEDISSAKKKVNDLMTEQLASVLPSKFGEYEMANEENMGYGGMEGQGVSMDKTYKKPQKEAKAEGAEAEGAMGMMMEMGNEPQLRVKITTDMMMANEVMSAHASSGMQMGGMSGEKTEAYRVGGYRAIHKIYSNEGGGEMGMEMASQQKREEAQAIVGGAFVHVTAEGLEDGAAKSFLEKVDFEKLIGIVGK